MNPKGLLLRSSRITGVIGSPSSIVSRTVRPVSRTGCPVTITGELLSLYVVEGYITHSTLCILGLELELETTRKGFLKVLICSRVSWFWARRFLIQVVSSIYGGVKLTWGGGRGCTESLVGRTADCRQTRTWVCTVHKYI